MKLKTWFLLLMIMGACKDKYMPNIKYPSNGFLVVEGFINPGKDSTIINLSRTSGLDSMQIIPETGAEIEVQSELGASYPLSEQQGGRYAVDRLPVDPAQKYRLHIKTGNGKEYLSDLSEVRFSPPIDSVTWEAGPDQVSIYVSTHDDQGRSQYYQWDYTETWVYNAVYVSNLIYYSHEFGPRPDAGEYYTCFMSGYSKNILLTSSVKLNKDVINRFPVTNISYTASNRLLTRYSTEVRQTVLSKEAYEWKQNLQKNTEELGSIFDPQPSETGGNIHCISDAGEPVVGFIWCSSQTVKRIFISKTELPPVSISTGYEGCKLDTVRNTQSKEDSTNKSNHFRSGTELPLNYLFDTQGISYVTGTATSCVDCRLHGGTIETPDFW
jgi:Domain of unknown function (DUF4249)